MASCRKDVTPIEHVKYRYRHLPIGGGGYVTGFFFHPADPSVLYCRTDIGGVYRFDVDAQAWVSLIDHVSHDDLRETCPISCALDPADPTALYIASGLWDPNGHGLLTVSHDRGETFVKHELPFFVHGNLHGRGAGERLLLDPNLPGTLWMASQLGGLWVSRDDGAHWTLVESFPETACTMIARVGSLLLVGAEGLAKRQDDMRGHSLYMSRDDGVTFEPVPQLEYVPVEGSKLHGLVVQRCTTDGQYLYVSYSANGPHSQNVDRGYTCDCGDCSCGRVARYLLTADGLGPVEDVTPEKGNWGYSAVSTENGLLVTATIHRRDGDAVYLSCDHGATWRTVLHGLSVGTMAFRLSYMKPEHNGGGNLIHWLTDVKLDPHRPGTAWFNTGTGVFRTQDITAENVIWQDWCDGMEETVHIGVHAPASGRVQVLDMIGDLGGFAFTDVDRHCDNSFANERGDRWITCLSCDWPDSDPDHIVVTARGNWTGKTQGGLIVTRDGAKTWNRLEMPMGLSEELVGLLSKISGVNINAGWVAVSADGNTYVWAVAERIRLHARNVIVSHDAGKTFRRSLVLDQNGEPAQGLMKPIADRNDPSLFYGFGEKGQLFVSTDGGDTFREMPAPDGFPQVNFGLVDCADQTEIRAAAGQPGVLYIAAGTQAGERGGLWKLCYDKADDSLCACLRTKPGDEAYCVGLGLGRPGGNYASEPKAIYIAGRISGEYGFYRTLDEGKTFQRINTDKQMFGRIHSVDGDKRHFGRFYLATGSSGLLYGEEEE